MLFLFFLVIFNNFLVIPVVRKKKKSNYKVTNKTCTCYSNGAPTIVVNEIVDTPPLAALKTIKA